MKEEEDAKPKIGAGHMKAMGRLGLRELRSAMYPASNVAQQHPEYGIYGNPTPQEIVDSKRADVAQPEPEKESVLADRMRQAEAREVPERDSKSMERE